MYAQGTVAGVSTIDIAALTIMWLTSFRGKYFRVLSDTTLGRLHPRGVRKS